MKNADLQMQIAPLRRHFEAGATRSLSWRRAQLKALVAMSREREGEIAAALAEDLGKSAFEAYVSEIGFIASHARHALKRLRRWARPRRRPVDLLNLPGRAWLQPEPRGVVLILAPWNYPWHLALSPLIGALAAGNCAVLKPSEFAPATSALLARLLPEYLDEAAVRVIEGDADVAQALLAEPFDLVFFTGSTAVGRKVMQAASAHLAPVVLELGGKSPTIVTRDADLAVAARRIAWGKSVNAGQTCVAPDYLLVESAVAKPFLDALTTEFRRQLGKAPRNSRDYGRIVSRRHFDRLSAMLGEGETPFGGQTDAEALFIAPTLLRNLPADAAAMNEEIFGPILPVIEVESIDAAIAHVRAGPKPLALYLFSKNRDTQRRVIAETSSGSVLINDVMMQVSPPGLPFGGVGASGMGTYHGAASFDSFSHLKPVLRKWTWGDIAVRYPPYSARARRWLRRLF
ncbi:aldehyde dehydrogenase family protein [Sinisalibacter lacisalsi]|uniref:Aldehyde dehydrogenase n=1 Tax=Sinisalibacter lacisalsi TaxID=1526570 RepID=A0ABQ1QQ98_9RHOB|nr:aldehyde dehydrogenase family protein [Sinisalibacter lacisalsi]GGD38240.1 aldehyde dehydrogenase [Sinisalibacter lacisalsi]